jgi:hypothetical protein
MGAGGWAVAFVLGAMLACAVVAWPLALANRNGHIAWWGWVLEAAWLFSVALAAGVANARKQKAAQA